MADTNEEMNYVKNNCYYYADCWGPDWEMCSEAFYDHAPFDLGNWRDNSLAAALTRLPRQEGNICEMVIKNRHVYYCFFVGLLLCWENKKIRQTLQNNKHFITYMVYYRLSYKHCNTIHF
jgi:hypothetical protein